MIYTNVLFVFLASENLTFVLNKESFCQVFVLL